MPTYDFKCKECGQKFTVMVAISEKEKVRCPECDSTNIQQLMTGFLGSISKDKTCSPGRHSGGG